MTLTGRVRAAGMLGVLLVSVGCYESEFPMDGTPQANVEQALVGVWRCVPHNAKVTERPATITVVRGRERTYAVTFQQDGKDAEHYEAYASMVQGTVAAARRLS